MASRKISLYCLVLLFAMLAMATALTDITVTADSPVEVVTITSTAASVHTAPTTAPTTRPVSSYIPPNMAATPPKQPAQKFPVIIIIAASIGGATVLAAALMGVYFCCCKRRRKPKAPVGDDFFAPPTSIVAPTSRQPQLPVIPPIPKTRTQSGRWARRSSTPAWPLKDEVPVAAAWNRRTPSPSPPPPSYQGRARPQMMVERLGTTAGREYAAGPVARGYVPPAWGQAGGFVHAERSMGERYGDRVSGIPSGTHELA